MRPQIRRSSAHTCGSSARRGRGSRSWRRAERKSCRALLLAGKPEAAVRELAALDNQERRACEDTGYWLGVALGKKGDYRAAAQALAEHAESFPTSRRALSRQSDPGSGVQGFSGASRKCLARISPQGGAARQSRQSGSIPCDKKSCGPVKRPVINYDDAVFSRRPARGEQAVLSGDTDPDLTA